MQRHHYLSTAAALFAACSSPPPQPEPAAHSHRHSTMVTITPTALLPEAVVHIPLMSTVVWQNRTAETVAIHVEAATCASCETVLGFESSPDGATCIGIAPGSVATLCFHQPGSFAFVASGAAVERRGTIVVAGEQR